MQVRQWKEVELSTNDWHINTWDLARNIALSFHQSIRGHSGLLSIVSKTVRVELADGPFDVPQSLTDDDRRVLTELLPQLPIVSTESTEVQRGQFKEVYLALKNRPRWLPVVGTHEDVLRIERRISDLQNEHLKELQKEVDDGNVKLFDGSGRAVSIVGLDTYVPRAFASRYLQNRGLLSAAAAESMQDDIRNPAEPAVITHRPRDFPPNSFDDFFDKVARDQLSTPGGWASVSAAANAVWTLLVDRAKLDDEQRPKCIVRYQEDIQTVFYVPVTPSRHSITPSGCRKRVATLMPSLAAEVSSH